MSQNPAVLLTILLTASLAMASDDLVRLNEQFIASYDRARTHLVSRISPLMICSGDNVTILHRGQRYEEQVIPKLYHDLKAISHIPFKIYLTVMFDEPTLSESNHVDLQRYLEDIRAVRSSLDIPADLRQAQYDIIDLSIGYLEKILSRKTIDSTELKAFCRQARRLFSGNIELAAQLQLDMLDAKIKPWYHDRFSNEEREALKVIILGPKTARHGSLEKTYFYKLLGEKREGKHVLYVEHADTEEKALEILGVWLLDAKAGVTFFDGDSERLHRDLLADASKAHAKRLFRDSSGDL